MVERRNGERVFCGDSIPRGFVVLNINTSGALLTSEKEIDLGKIIQIALRLGPVIRVELSAIVKWCKLTGFGTYMMGVSFGEEQNAVQLNRYLAFLRTLTKLAA